MQMNALLFALDMQALILAEINYAPGGKNMSW